MSKIKRVTTFPKPHTTLSSLDRGLAIKTVNESHGTIEISNEFAGLPGFGVYFTEDEYIATSDSFPKPHTTLSSLDRGLAIKSY